MAQKTYWHLSRQGRIPTEYEIVSSQLLYYVGREPSVRTPVSEWMMQGQASSPAHAVDWEAFSDPRQTTYRSYVALQNAEQIYLNGVLEGATASHASLLGDKDWRRAMEVLFAPMRYPCHGLMMLAAYIGQIAPCGKLTLCCGFQVADEMRHVDGLARYLAMLARHDAAFVAHAKAHWQEHPCWQPMRRVIEELLIPAGWFESLIALNLVLKPLFDGVVLGGLAQAAREHGDELLRRLLKSFLKDSAWQRSWTRTALGTALHADKDDNMARVIHGVVDAWYGPVLKAVQTIEVEFPGFETNAPETRERRINEYKIFVRACGLRPHELFIHEA